MYCNASVFSVRKEIAKFWFMESLVKSACVPSNSQNKPFSAENDIIDLQALICVENHLLQERRIIDDYKKEKHGKVCIHDRLEIV